MKTDLIYNKENREEFFAKIDELTEKDKHTECINALESIPAEERELISLLVHYKILPLQVMMVREQITTQDMNFY